MQNQKDLSEVSKELAFFEVKPEREKLDLIERLKRIPIEERTPEQNYKINRANGMTSNDAFKLLILEKRGTKVDHANEEHVKSLTSITKKYKYGRVMLAIGTIFVVSIATLIIISIINWLVNPYQDGKLVVFGLRLTILVSPIFFLLFMIFSVRSSSKAQKKDLEQTKDKNK